MAGEEIPVIVQKEPKKKRKGYCCPAGLLKTLEIIFCLVTLIFTEIGRWKKLITILGYSDAQKTKETGVFQYWGFLPFGFYHAHILVLCILAVLACFSFFLLLIFITRTHECCGRRALRYWLTVDFVYSLTGICLSFIAFAVLCVFCAYPEVWRKHLFGDLDWRNVHNIIIIIAAALGFVTLCLFVGSSVVSGCALNREMKKPKPERRRKERIVIIQQQE